MSSTIRRSTHLSRHLQLLREQRGLRPGQLAVALGARNPSKVGSLIRAFELGEPLSDHWLQKLVAELRPVPADLGRCLELDQAEAKQRREQERLEWEDWVRQPIDPVLSIRYFPGTGQTHLVPCAFLGSREQAEHWAVDQLKHCPHRSILTWSRRELTLFEEHGLHPRRRTVSFQERHFSSWTPLSASQWKGLERFR